MPLSSQELERYARHITLGQVGVEGQKRLKASKVLCIGSGGLGSPVTMYLAAAGVGAVLHNHHVAEPRLVSGASPTWRKPRLV